MFFKESYCKNEVIYLLFLFLAMLCLFFYIDNTLIPIHDMYNFLDEYIPFVPVFVVPYFIWFPFFVCPCIYFSFKSKKDLVKSLRYIVLGFAISNLIYLLYPNRQSLRPQFYNDDIFSQAVKYLQEADSPANVFPSLHVYISLAMTTVIWQYKGFKNNFLVKITYLIIAVFICLSTVFIKQHSVVDIIGGFILWVLIKNLFFKAWFYTNVNS